MAGYNTKETTEISTVFSRTVASPLDKWSNISSITSVDTELPPKIRFVGMLVFVEDEDVYYFFKGGIENINLVLLSGELEGIRTFDTIVNTTQSQIVEVEHGLGAGNINVTFQHENEYLLNGWKRGKIDGTNTDNYIHFSTENTLVGVQIFIIAKSIDSSNSSNPNLDATIVNILNTINILETGAVKSVNNILPDVNGNVNVVGGVVYDLSLIPVKINHTYFGEDVYATLLQIDAPVIADTNTIHTFNHNLNVGKYLKILVRSDNYIKGSSITHISAEEDLAKIVNENVSSSLEVSDNTIETYNVNYPTNTYLYVEYTLSSGTPTVEGIGSDSIGGGDIG